MTKKSEWKKELATIKKLGDKETDYAAISSIYNRSARLERKAIDEDNEEMEDAFGELTLKLETQHRQIQEIDALIGRLQEAAGESGIFKKTIKAYMVKEIKKF